MEGAAEVDPARPRGEPYTACGEKRKRRRVTESPLTPGKQRSHSACVYWSPVGFTRKGTQTSTHTRVHTRTPPKDFILVLDLCNLVQQTTRLLLEEQLDIALHLSTLHFLAFPLTILGTKRIIVTIRLTFLKILNAI